MPRDNGRCPRWFTDKATLICIDCENDCVCVVISLEMKRMEATIVSCLMRYAMGEECSCVDVQVIMYGDGEVIAQFYGICDEFFGGDISGTGQIRWKFGGVK